MDNYTVTMLLILLNEMFRSSMYYRLLYELWIDINNFSNKLISPI